VWEAETEWAATLRARHHAAATWTIEAGLTAGTGASPLYVQVGGEWRAADIRTMTGGTWHVV
jgi:hypothetical protein